MKTATLLLYEGKLQHFDKLYLSVFHYCISITTPLLNTSAYLSFHGCIINYIKL